MSIRWIRNVMVEGQKATLEILLGNSEISDKCYVRINGGREYWFNPTGNSRDHILNQGVDILKEKLKGKKVTTPLGKEFDWN